MLWFQDTLSLWLGNRDKVVWEHWNGIRHGILRARTGDFLVRTVVYGSDTRCNLLCLEEQDGAVTEIEVDKMLRFWTGSAYALRLVSFAR